MDNGGAWGEGGGVSVQFSDKQVTNVSKFKLYKDQLSFLPPEHSTEDVLIQILGIYSQI